jgi:hypothetical protein
MKALTRLALLILTAVAVVPASARQLPTSDTKEASASMLSMPASESGLLLVKTCGSCKGITFRASAQTAYVIGQKRVSLQDFSAFVRENGNAFVAVRYDIAQSLLLSLTASPLTTSGR